MLNLKDLQSGIYQWRVDFPLSLPILTRCFANLGLNSTGEQFTIIITVRVSSAGSPRNPFHKFMRKDQVSSTRTTIADGTCQILRHISSDRKQRTTASITQAQTDPSEPEDPSALQLPTIITHSQPIN